MRSGEDLKIMHVVHFCEMEGQSSSETVVKYVGHKVSCLRWKPQPSGAIESSDVFISGSYDDEVGFVVRSSGRGVRYLE